MKKQYPGHAKRVMFGVWSFLRQFMYTKFIIVTDDDVNVARLEGRDLGDDHAHGPGARHADRREHADRLPRLRLAVAGLGSKMGFDATNKWPGETSASGAARSRWTPR